LLGHVGVTASALLIRVGDLIVTFRTMATVCSMSVGSDALPQDECM
jgi:hypothetical protein